MKSLTEQTEGVLQYREGSVDTSRYDSGVLLIEANYGKYQCMTGLGCISMLKSQTEGVVTATDARVTARKILVWKQIYENLELKLFWLRFPHIPTY